MNKYPGFIAIAAALPALFVAALAQEGIVKPEVDQTPLSALHQQVQQEEEEWIQLFNGQDLTGWRVKIRGYDLDDNYGNTFRVEDSVLKVSYDQYDTFDNRFGHIFYEIPYTYYLLRVEYRFTGEQCPGGENWAWRNSGVMIHGQSAGSMRKDQRFPVSIEVQLLGGDGENERTTANLCTPGTNVEIGGKLWTQHCTNSASSTYHGDGWVTLEIEVRGGEVIRHIMEGDTVLQYNEPQLDPEDEDARWLLEGGADMRLDHGSISLQSESHPVEFRKVELRVLED